jgi:hypothetical protein
MAVPHWFDHDTVSTPRIVRPLLIGQGANDVRVKAAESEQIVAAMQRHGIPVTCIYYPDEGHGLVRPRTAGPSPPSPKPSLLSTLAGANSRSTTISMVQPSRSGQVATRSPQKIDDRRLLLAPSRTATRRPDVPQLRVKLRCGAPTAHSCSRPI